MRIDLQDIAFWMDAIRDSENHYGILESFWKGQLQSKEWLIENLKKFVPTNRQNLSIVIHGGWNGVLASLLYNSEISINLIRSIDIDKSCEDVANMINKRQEMNSQFLAVTADMCFYEYEFTPDIVINTSTEHLTKEKYNAWFDKIPNNSLIVLQNNNYYEISEHVNCYSTIDKFSENCNLKNIIFKDTLSLPRYDRFLVIGYK